MNKKTKLLITIPNLYGGTGTFCRNLAYGIKKYYPKNYYIALLILDNKDFIDEDNKLFDSVDILHSKATDDARRFLKVFIHWYKVRNKIKEINPDIIFSIGTYFNILTSLSFNKEKLLLSEHDARTERLKHSRYRNVIGYFMKVIYKNRKVIGVSQTVVDDLINNYGVKNANLINYGTNGEKLNKLSNLPINDNNIAIPYVISVGRLTLQKDYETLLKAFSISVKNGIRENLIILGEGENRNSLEKLLGNLKLSSRVKFIGYKKNPYPYIKNARIFVLSSIWEGFPLVLLEALTLGVPILSTNCISGPSEMLDNGQYGTLTPIKDVDKLGEKITALLLDNDKLDELSKKSKLRAKNYTIEKMTKKYQKTFEELLSG